jgi:hypothetical protein
VAEPSTLSGWESFYVIVGSSGGGLIGLQFVVLTLIADKQRHTNPETLSAFGTPTVVHLAGALVISAAMSVPWPSNRALSLALIIGGLAGLLYSARVVQRARRQTGYDPEPTDWVWYAALPSAAYGVLAVSGFLLHSSLAPALYLTAASALSLLLIGIHNAWDTVTHILITSPENTTTAPRTGGTNGDQ